MTVGIVLTVLGVLMSGYAVVAHHYPGNVPKMKLWVVALVITWAVLGYDIYNRHHAQGYDARLAWDDSKAFERDYTHTFSNETVLLDNKHLLAPVTFDNVTLLYNGTGGFTIDAPITFTRASDGRVTTRIASRNKVFNAGIQLADLIAKAAGCNVGYDILPPNSHPELGGEQK